MYALWLVPNCVDEGRTLNLTLTMHVSCAPSCGGGSSGPLARLNLPGNSWNTWLVTAIEVTFCDISDTFSHLMGQLMSVGRVEELSCVGVWILLV